MHATRDTHRYPGVADTAAFADRSSSGRTGAPWAVEPNLVLRRRSTGSYRKSRAGTRPSPAEGPFSTGGKIEMEPFWGCRTRLGMAQPPGRPAESRGSAAGKSGKGTCGSTRGKACLRHPGDGCRFGKRNPVGSRWRFAEIFGPPPSGLPHGGIGSLFSPLRGGLGLWCRFVANCLRPGNGFVNPKTPSERDLPVHPDS